MSDVAIDLINVCLRREYKHKLARDEQPLRGEDHRQRGALAVSWG
jgi:hypothetical protein